MRKNKTPVRSIQEDAILLITELIAIQSSQDFYTETLIAQQAWQSSDCRMRNMPGKQVLRKASLIEFNKAVSYSTSLEHEMKKYLLSTVIALGLTTSMQTQAASGYGLGCNVWGPVSYVYAGEGGSFMAIVNGYACVINGVADRPMVSAASAILSEALAAGKQAYVGVSNGLLVASTQ